MIILILLLFEFILGGRSSTALGGKNSIHLENISDKIKISGRCIHLASENKSSSVIAEMCKDLKSHVCATGGKCKITRHRDGSACYQLTCPNGNLEPTECFNELKKDGSSCQNKLKERCQFYKNETNNVCENKGKCYQQIKNCCFKFICRQETDDKKISDYKKGVTSIFPINEALECNRTLCPSLPSLCRETGTCLEKPICTNGKCHSCIINVKCDENYDDDDNIRHFHIDYEAPEKITQRVPTKDFGLGGDDYSFEPMYDYEEEELETTMNPNAIAEHINLITPMMTTHSSPETTISLYSHPVFHTTFIPKLEEDEEESTRLPFDFRQFTINPNVEEEIYGTSIGAAVHEEEYTSRSPSTTETQLILDIQDLSSFTTTSMDLIELTIDTLSNDTKDEIRDSLKERGEYSFLTRSIDGCSSDFCQIINNNKNINNASFPCSRCNTFVDCPRSNKCICKLIVFCPKILPSRKEFFREEYLFHHWNHPKILESDKEKPASDKEKDFLRNGGSISFNVNNATECSNETRCREYYDVCEQVGTCFVESKCSDEKQCDCLLTVTCSIKVNTTDVLKKEYEQVPSLTRAEIKEHLRKKSKVVTKVTESVTCDTNLCLDEIEMSHCSNIKDSCRTIVQCYKDDCVCEIFNDCLIEVTTQTPIIPSTTPSIAQDIETLKNGGLVTYKPKSGESCLNSSECVLYDKICKPLKSNCYVQSLCNNETLRRNNKNCECLLGVKCHSYDINKRTVLAANSGIPKPMSRSDLEKKMGKYPIILTKLDNLSCNEEIICKISYDPACNDSSSGIVGRICEVNSKCHSEDNCFCEIYTPCLLVNKTEGKITKTEKIVRTGLNFPDNFNITSAHITILQKGNSLAFQASNMSSCMAVGDKCDKFQKVCPGGMTHCFITGQCRGKDCKCLISTNCTAMSKNTLIRYISLHGNITTKLDHDLSCDSETICALPFQIQCDNIDLDCKVEPKCEGTDCFCDINVKCPPSVTTETNKGHEGRGGGISIETQEVHIKYTIQGLVAKHLQPEFICDDKKICKKVTNMCFNPESASCNVNPLCIGEYCECNVDLNCGQNILNNNEIITSSPTSNEANKSLNNPRRHDDQFLTIKDQEQLIQSKERKALNFQLFLSKEDIKVNGTETCLRSCKSTLRNCPDKSCKVSFKCFHDYCHCNVDVNECKKLS